MDISTTTKTEPDQLELISLKLFQICPKQFYTWSPCQTLSLCQCSVEQHRRHNRHGHELKPYMYTTGTWNLELKPYNGCVALFPNMEKE